jgi:hypothetical protein
MNGNMNNSDHDEFWKAGLHGDWSAEDEARHRAAAAENCPEALARFEEELRLNRLLRQLPDKTLASNFTSGVLRAVEQETRNRDRSAAGGFWRRWGMSRLGRGLAFGSVLLAAGGLVHWQYQISARRELAQTLMRVSRVMKPTLGMLGDMKAIEGFREVSVASVGEINLVEALQ